MGLSASAPWTKYYGDTPASLDYPYKTMYQMVAAAAKQYPTGIAYVFMGKETTYAAFMKRIDAAARGLYRLGIRKGDKVTICMANTPQALDCFYALNRIGAIPNMIHPLSAAKEIAFYLNFSKSKAILTLDQFYYKVAEILPELENPTQVLIAKVVDELPFPLKMTSVTEEEIRGAAAHAVEIAGGADQPAARVALTWEKEMLEKLADLRDTEDITSKYLLLGGVPVVAFPFEGFTKIGQEVREILGRPDALMLGCGEELLGYLPTRDDIAREAYAALESTFLYKRLPVVPGEAERLGEETGYKLKESLA